MSSRSPWIGRTSRRLSNYTRGRAFEYRVRNKLLASGAVYVMRAAQSKGKADLAAFWPSKDWPSHAWPWLLQCKTGTARMSNKEKRDFVQLALDTDTLAVLAEPGKNGRGIKLTDLHTQKEIEL